MSGLGDPLNFVTAEACFKEMKTWPGPVSIKSVIMENPANIEEPNYGHRVTVTSNNDTLCIVQFIRPTVSRIRYDPAVKSKDEYGDENS